MATATPRIYVGTYAKYNNGSLKGAWLSLDNYTDRDEFLEACRELHKDEDDPELMFQDYEGFPESFYSESHIKPELWDHVNPNGDIDEARDNFAGKANSESDWAAEFLDDTGQLSEVPENLRNYIDFEAYARDARIGGNIVFARHDGELWVFWNR